MPKTLLVVDDSATIREAAKLALTGEGWSVLEAATSEEALSLLRAESPDAVLCDVALGDEDGYELCRRIHLLPEGAGVPVVLMGSKVSHAAATAVGAAGDLPKPFGSDELTDTLRSALDSVAFDLHFSDLQAGADASAAPEAGFPEFDEARPDEDLEIIELSGSDNFEELELLEDLEPVTLAPSTPPRGAATESARGEPEEFPAAEEPEDFFASERSALLDEALGDERSLELDAFQEREPNPPTEESKAPPATPEPDFGSSELEFGSSELELGSSELELSAEAEPEFASSELELGSSDLELSAETEPESGSSKLELPPFAEPEPGAAAAEPSTPVPEPGPTQADLLTSQIARTAEQAARAALEKSLSAESLLPAVEAIVERVVWEVVPALAERLIQEAIEKLRQEPDA